MNLEFPAVFYPLLTEKSRYKVSDGGRGGGRSWSFARASILRAIKEKTRILCAREYQNSIKDSVMRVLVDQIELMGLTDFFKVTQNSIIGKNGSEYLFKGLHHNAAEIKSTEGVDVCWIEEAEAVTADSWDVLIPTIRKPDSEIWISFNPRLETDPTYQRFIVNPPPGTIRMRAGWRENPWFPDVLREQLEHDQKTNPDRYSWIWEGNCLKMSSARVFKNWKIDTFEAPADAVFRFGADWGFATDPTTLVRCHVIGRKLYIDHEAYMVGCEIVDTPSLFLTVPEAEKWPIVADSSRPETISHLRKNGFPKIMPAVKGKDSVIEGVEFLKSYEIIVHPRCKHTIEELSLYSYQVDKGTGAVLPILEDKDNHVIDALRYALEGVRRVQAAAPIRSVNVIPSVNPWGK